MTAPTTELRAALVAFQEEYLMSGVRETPEWRRVFRALDLVETVIEGRTEKSA